MKSKSLAITGMHRSGTSLIAQWLHKCGLVVGESLAGESESNPDGHFEDNEFLYLHKEILVDNNLTDTGLTDQPIPYISRYKTEKLKTVLNIKNQLYPEWGWKEPRTCLFLDMYKELLPDAYYLVIIRDYQTVIDSLIRRDFLVVDKKYLSRKFFSRLIWKTFRRPKRLRKTYSKYAEHYLKVWITYNEHILKHIASIEPDKYVVVNASLLLQMDQDVIRHINNEWNFNLEFVHFNSVYKERLLSSKASVNEYITDKKLINKAIQVERALMEYMFNKTPHTENNYVTV